MKKKEQDEKVHPEKILRIFEIRTFTPEEQARILADELFLSQRSVTEAIFSGLDRLTGDEHDVQLRLSECLRAVYHCRVDICVWWNKSNKTRYHCMVNPFGMGALRWVSVPCKTLSAECMAALSGLISGGHFTEYFDPDRHVYDLKAFRFTDHVRDYIMRHNVTHEWFRVLLTRILEDALERNISEHQLKTFQHNLVLECTIGTRRDELFLIACSSLIQSVTERHSGDDDAARQFVGCI